MSIDMSSFVLFERPARNSWIRKPAAVTLGKEGNTLHINANAQDRLRHPAYVVILFNKKERVVAIRACDPAEVGAKAVRGKSGNVSTYKLGKLLSLEPGPRPVELVEGHLLFKMDKETPQ
ncbi:hypothetical protein [Deinococcus phoenicis]|uniref:hypothetical protein n=1 Tax=Deinococcus phoenicis TaxID=1476583 RepID=UPI0012693F35|nr:hypothetical protein [Deinococcus phoenicis]